MAEHQGGTGGLDLETLVADLYRNILATSSTARGEEASKERPGKVRLGITGAALASMVRANSARVADIILRAVWEKWSARRVIQDVIEATLAGFPSKTREWRKHRTKDRPSVNPVKIPREAKRFRKMLSANLDRWEPVRLAAWTEWMWAEHIHPLGDGCGRTSKALSAWVLVRRGLPLPSYVGGAEAYNTASAAGLQNFTEYYRVCMRGEVGERRPPKRVPARESRTPNPRRESGYVLRLRRAS